MNQETIQVLLVEDNPTDVMVMEEALDHSRVPHTLHVAQDGVEAMEFLRNEGRHSSAPRPGLILLDLNMPRKSGREVLAEIKSIERLRSIPVVILTTSGEESDILKAYLHDASYYFQKSNDTKTFAEVIRCIEKILTTVLLSLPRG